MEAFVGMCLFRMEMNFGNAMDCFNVPVDSERAAIHFETNGDHLNGSLKRAAEQVKAILI